MTMIDKKNKTNTDLQALFLPIVAKLGRENPETMNEWVKHAPDTGSQTMWGFHPMTCWSAVQHATIAPGEISDNW